MSNQYTAISDWPTPGVFPAHHYRTDARVRTWWEAGWAVPEPDPVSLPQRVEVAVIGGGLTGLSAARRLAGEGRAVVVLDAGPLGWGSSGRNGGMVCYPALKLSLDGLRTRVGEAEARRFLQMQLAGVAHTQSLACEVGIDPDAGGAGFFEVAHSPQAAEALAASAEKQRNDWGLDCAFVQLDRRPHGGPESHGAIRYADGFAVNPLQLVAGLADLAAQAGAILAWRTPVLSMQRNGDGWRLETGRGEIAADTVVLATNAYTSDRLVPELARRVLPAISTIVVSDPLPQGLRDELGMAGPFAAFDARALLTYYRLLPDGRLLLGARGGWRGRHTDEALRGEVLRQTIARKFPALAGLRTPWCWSGKVATTRNLAPSMGALAGGGLLFAIGCHGNGLNTAPWMGEELAGAALAPLAHREAQLARRIPRLMLGRPAALPPVPPSARRFLLAAALGSYALKDRLHDRGAPGKPATVATTPRPHEGDPVLSVRALHKRFGSHDVLKGVDIEARKGEVISILGGSGSGKSTLLRCIAHLELPDSGDVAVGPVAIRANGRPPDRQALQALRRRIGMVFQSFNLWSHMTVLQNICEVPVHTLGQPRDMAEAAARQLLERVGLGTLAHRYPATLSGGQQQRAAIARALAVNPEVLLFDEPTSALDPELVGEVLAVMRELAAEHRTMLVVTHEIAFARKVSDRVIFMANGAIEVAGRPEEVLDDPASPLLRRFLGTLGADAA